MPGSSAKAAASLGVHERARLPVRGTGGDDDLLVLRSHHPPGPSAGTLRLSTRYASSESGSVRRLRNVSTLTACAPRLCGLPSGVFSCAPESAPWRSAWCDRAGGVSHERKERRPEPHPRSRHRRGRDQHREAGPTDAVEDYAGESGLQYLGDGNSQFNWKTLKDYAGQCRMLTLELSDGTTLTADFKFTN